MTSILHDDHDDDVVVLECIEKVPIVVTEKNIVTTITEEEDSAEALRRLTEGIRFVARTMKAMSCPAGEPISLGPQEECLDGELWNLLQAARLVHERARLVNDEASVLTADVTEAQTAAGEALERAHKAERFVKRLYKENQSLEHQLERLMVERKVLAREVKSLQRENAALKEYQQDTKRKVTLLALEQHVLDALEVHETHLKQKSESKQEDDFANEFMTPTAFPQTPRFGENENNNNNNNNQQQQHTPFSEKENQENKEEPQQIRTMKNRSIPVGLAGCGYYRTPSNSLDSNAARNKDSPENNKENHFKPIQLACTTSGPTTPLASAITNFFHRKHARRQEKKNPVKVPRNVALQHEPTVSPFADDSPVARRMDVVADICDHDMLRSLALPETLSPSTDNARES